MMSRNLKLLGLALVAVLALSAVSSSPAFALTPKAKVAEGDGNLEATQIGTNQLTLSGGRTFQCTTVKLTASLAAVSPTVENIVPTYSGCTSTLAGVTLPATVTVNTCTYTAHVGATTGVTDQYAATADIRCPAGKVIDLEIYKEGTTPPNHNPANELCHYTVGGAVGGANQGLGSPTATNITTSDIEANLNISGIAYTRTNGSIPNCGAATSTATLSGKLTIVGKTTAGAASIVQIVEV